MTPDQIRHYLGGHADPHATLQFLSQSFIPEVVRQLNEPGTRRRMALYGGDRIPENERNLTDVRNRMSLLIEYKLAWIGNDILEDAGIHDLFWTNVVANRFPDLEVRSDQGARGIRVEVKCLEAIAEEKSANFDTLKKDLSPLTDYVAIFVWEWVRDARAILWDRAPMVLRSFIFHASSLAELRDYNWLSNPPGEVGDGFQGFDLRYAVNCRNGVYNEEEGNYGKLLRIWSNGISYGPGVTPLLERTIQDYQEFEDYTVWSGFEVLSHDLLQRFGEGKPIAPLKLDGRGIVGFRAGDIGTLFRRRVLRTRDQHAVAAASGVRRLIILTDKYQWADAEVSPGALRRIADGRKPKHLVTHLSGS